ncbi:unnamed protein product [Lasius platythorax]|uniref:Uncharacterized protein n=1 Tax=Lasius platythorax TaxID=488582 RepID=A0AAV2P6X7_9HYME
MPMDTFRARGKRQHSEHAWDRRLLLGKRKESFVFKMVAENLKVEVDDESNEMSKKFRGGSFDEREKREEIL